MQTQETQPAHVLTSSPGTRSCESLTCASRRVGAQVLLQ